MPRMRRPIRPFSHSTTSAAVPLNSGARPLSGVCRSTEPFTRRRVRDLRLVLACVLERPADGPAIGDLKPLYVRGDISADTRVDLHVCATGLKVAADLTADRGVRRADDHVSPNPPIAQDRQLVSTDDEIAGAL